VLVGDALDPYSIALDFFSGKAVPCRPTAVRCHPQGTGEGQLGGAGLGAGILRYPISATAAEKALPHKGRESFPSWTSPVRPRSPALVKAPTSQGLPRRSVRSPVGEPASGLVILMVERA
jgi:hypothetical protein